MLNQGPYPAEAVDPFCLRDGEAARLLAGHPWRRFAVLGDSIAQGLGDPVDGYPDQPWCDRLAAELTAVRPGLAYLNLGASNSTAARVRARQLDAALAFSPDLAVVACGGYDVLRFSYDLAGTDAELRTIVRALTAAKCDVITVGLFDGSYAPGLSEQLRESLRERLHELSRRMRAISADLGTVHVELTWHPASRDADLYSKDLRHGTMRGHAIAAAETIRCLGGFLGTGPSPVAPPVTEDRSPADPPSADPPSADPPSLADPSSAGLSSLPSSPVAPSPVAPDGASL